MRLTSLDCSYHPLHHGTSQAQRLTVGEPLDARGPIVARLDAEGPRVTLADGAEYVWTPVGWGRVAPQPATASTSMATATVEVAVPAGDHWRTVRTYEVGGSTTVRTYEETHDDTTDIGQHAGAAGDGVDGDAERPGPAIEGPPTDRGDVGASASSGTGALPGGAARPSSGKRAR